MKKLFQFTGLVALCFILYGCPMDTSVPIDHPRANYIDNNLLGSWKNRSDGKIYTLSKYDDYTYKVSFTYSDGTWGYYYSFMSFVNNQSFLCVAYYDQELQQNRYYLLGITTSNNVNTLSIRGLNDPYLFHSSSAELKNWIASNMYNSSFYSTDTQDTYILDRY